MKKETRDTFILLVAISLSRVCDCGLLIAELASDIPAGSADVHPLEICGLFRKHPYQSLHLPVAVEEASKEGLMLPGSA